MKCKLLHILFQSRDKNYDVSSWSILLILLTYISNIKFTLLNFLPANTFYQKIIIKTKNKKNRGMKRKAKGICHRIRRSSWSSLKHPLPSIDKNFILVTYIKNNVVVNSHLVHFSVKRRMRCYCIPTVGSAPCYPSGLILFLSGVQNIVSSVIWSVPFLIICTTTRHLFLVLFPSALQNSRKK